MYMQSVNKHPPQRKILILIHHLRLDNAILDTHQLRIVNVKGHPARRVIEGMEFRLQRAIHIRRSGWNLHIQGYVVGTSRQERPSLVVTVTKLSIGEVVE